MTVADAGKGGALVKVHTLTNKQQLQRTGAPVAYLRVQSCPHHTQPTKKRRRAQTQHGLPPSHPFLPSSALVRFV